MRRRERSEVLTSIFLPRHTSVHPRRKGDDRRRYSCHPHPGPADKKHARTHARAHDNPRRPLTASSQPASRFCHPRLIPCPSVLPFIKADEAAEHEQDRPGPGYRLRDGGRGQAGRAQEDRDEDEEEKEEVQAHGLPREPSHAQRGEPARA